MFPSSAPNDSSNGFGINSMFFSKSSILAASTSVRLANLVDLFGRQFRAFYTLTASYPASNIGIF